MHTHINITNQFGRSFRALLTHYQTSAREPYIDIVDAESDKKITQFFRKTFINEYEKGSFGNGLQMLSYESDSHLDKNAIKQIYDWLIAHTNTLSPFDEQPALTIHQQHQLLTMIDNLSRNIADQPESTPSISQLQHVWLPFLKRQVLLSHPPSLSGIIEIELTMHPSQPNDTWSPYVMNFLISAGLAEVPKSLVNNINEMNNQAENHTIDDAIANGDPLSRYVWADINPIAFANQFYQACPLSMQQRLWCIEPLVIDAMIDCGKLDAHNLSPSERSLLFLLAESPQTLIDTIATSSNVKQLTKQYY